MPSDISIGVSASIPSIVKSESETPNQKNLIESNQIYASTFKQGDLALPPAKKICITCMDARINPSAAFGIPLGDAHIIRNAGGSARDALRSLIISQQLLGTGEILLIKHTAPGMLTFENNDAVGIVEERLGEGAKKELQGFGGDFLAFAEVEAEVRRDVRWLRGAESISREVVVSGWVMRWRVGGLGGWFRLGVGERGMGDACGTGFV